MRSTLLLLALAGCGTTTVGVDAGAPVADASVVSDGGSTPPDAGDPDGGAPDAGTVDAGVTRDAGFVDRDLDGLDDDFELEVARGSLPVLAVHPQDRCPLGGLVFRLRPHPTGADAGLLAITWTHLFERDCGLTSHVGDNEGFGATINPALPPEQRISALRAIAHQATLCERTTTCGRCAGLTPCERPTPSEPPLVFSSRDKHAGYLSLSACGTLTCLDVCAMGRRTGVPLVNAGEPDAPLTRDLTDGGFITTANGWTEQSLFHFDPWGAADFGSAGNVKGDLEDAAFLTPACL